MVGLLRWLVGRLLFVARDWWPGYLTQKTGDYGGMEYTATMAVPAGTQLVHNYGASWWKDRPELKRCDVGTAPWPMIPPGGVLGVCVQIGEPANWAVSLWLPFKKQG